MIKTYSELIKFQTFDERFEYLMLNGKVGEELFGYARYLNQVFYTSGDWKRARRKAIIRDNGCDLGVEGFEINGIIYVHHINPITIDQLINNDPLLLDLDNLICTSRSTHEAITLGDRNLLLIRNPVIRVPNDTSPWKN
jgi:hypothetical protein